MLHLGQISAPPHLGLAVELGATFLTIGAATGLSAMLLEEALLPLVTPPPLSTASVSRLLLLLSVRGAFFGATYAAAW